MKKKRIKFGLAILGGLAAFLLALLALVFAPTGASAGKGPAFGQEQDGGGHSGHPNPAYFDPPTGGNDNDSHHANGGGSNPCTGNHCDNHDGGAPGDESWHYANGGQGGGQSGGQGQDQGNGHSSNNDSGGQGGRGNSWFAGGGYSGGGGGGGGYGAPHDKSGACSSKKDKDKDEESKDKESDDKTCDSDDDKDDSAGNANSGDDAGSQQFASLNDKNPSGDSNDDTSDDDTSDNTSGNTSTNFVSNDAPPAEDDLPPDPNCFPFAESCDTHENNPPNPDQTDPTHEVPEPLTLSLFAVGLAGAATLRRARQKTAARPD